MIDAEVRKQLRRSSELLYQVPTLAVASLIVAAAFAPAGADAAEPKNGFGTLFYSPQERAAISAARRVVPGAAASSGTTISMGVRDWQERNRRIISNDFIVPPNPLDAILVTDKLSFKSPTEIRILLTSTLGAACTLKEVAAIKRSAINE